MRIAGHFSLSNNSNSSKLILPEILIISELKSRNPLPCQKVDFSAVKRVEFLSDAYYNSDPDATIQGEFIRYLFRSCENLKEVIFDKSFFDFTSNTSNLLVVPNHRKLKFLSMSVTSPDKTLS